MLVRVCLGKLTAFCSNTDYSDKTESQCCAAALVPKSSFWTSDNNNAKSVSKYENKHNMGLVIRTTLIN